VVLPPSNRGQGRRNQIAAPKSDFPAADPGDVAAHRWRERFTRKVEGRNAIDPEKLQIALSDAQRACLRICEQQPLGTVRGTEGTASAAETMRHSCPC
jgi:hypothetical protein